MEPRGGLPGKPEDGQLVGGLLQEIGIPDWQRDRDLYRACNEAGIDPAFEMRESEGSRASLVINLYLTHRQLNRSQQTVVWTVIATYWGPSRRK